MTVLRSIQRLVGQKSHSRDARDGEVDELRASEPDRAVAGGAGGENDNECPEDGFQSGVQTAESYRTPLMQKRDIRTTVGLVRYAFLLRLVESPGSG